MATEMDIDMDLDIDTAEDYNEDINEQAIFSPQHFEAQNLDVAANDFLSDPDGNQLTPQKIHIRGLDNLTSADLTHFISEHFSGERFERIEWIDDTSANIIYSTPEIAFQVLKALVATEIVAEKLPNMQLLPTRSFTSHPDSHLEVRLAVASDKKVAGARERSRFYLFNPEYDPAERRVRRERQRKYRDRDDDGYRSRPFDEREQQRREDMDLFDASLYDDDEATLALRSIARQNRRASGTDQAYGRNKAQQTKGSTASENLRKELFPERLRERSDGRLRQRSASPSRDSDGDERMQTSNSRAKTRVNVDNGSSENRVRASIIKAVLRDTVDKPKELFPQKSGSNHRRSAAFDAADNTADLFADKMTTPLVDGSSDFPPKKGSLSSRITILKTGGTKHEERDTLRDGRAELNLGSSRQNGPVDFTIKGAASTGSLVKELFPSRFNNNSGKELFTEKLEGRGGRRRRAEDMFH